MADKTKFSEQAMPFMDAMIPALAVAALVLLLATWLGGMAIGLLPAAACACAVLALELHLALGVLGRRVDRFDVSQELR